MKKMLIGVVAVIFIVGIIFLFENPVSSTAPQPQNTPSVASSGKLEITDTLIGTGSAVKSGDSVVINYKGTLSNGKQFDSSYDRGTPFETQIGVGQVIKGWDEGIIGMRVGGKRHLVIPPDLAYGAQGVPGSIPANATLIFDVQLVGIK